MNLEKLSIQQLQNEIWSIGNGMVPMGGLPIEDYQKELSRKVYEADLIEASAGKFLADHSRITPVTDETLEKAYERCVCPPKQHLYPSIKKRIEEMRNDGISKFYEED